MVCTNCARIWQETGVCPDHYNQGNIATCPEDHHRNCNCSRCCRARIAARPRPSAPWPVTAPVSPPVPTPVPRPVSTPVPRSVPTPVPPPAPRQPARHSEQVIRFVSPTSTTPRCSELISECPVCLVDFDDSVASVNTSCGHKICVACFTTMLVSNLRQAFNKKTNCPMCRSTIVEQASRS
jgi:hypothetical protein